jgi:nitrogen PTS system EIIA component
MSIDINDLLAPNRVMSRLAAGNKAELIAELAHQVASEIPVEMNAVAAAISARERLGSTGLGRGFALPHAKLGGVDTLFGLFARLARPIDFEAIDGQPVDLVFLLLIPQGMDHEHIAALAAVARAMRDEDMCRELRSLRTAEAIFERLTRRA